MNKAILMGRLTKDAEIKYSQSIEPVAITRFTIAVNRRFKRENEPEADFINCVAFGKTGEFINKYFSKGKMIAIAGRIQTGSYTNSEGKKVYTTDVLVEEANFCGGKSDENNHNNNTNDDFYSVEYGVSDDDLPF